MSSISGCCMSLGGGADRVARAIGPAVRLSHGVSHGVRRTWARCWGGYRLDDADSAVGPRPGGGGTGSSDTLFHAIKWAGAAYLVYLGVSTWRGPARQPASPAAQSAEVAVPATSLPSATWGQLPQGLPGGIGNPRTCCSQRPVPAIHEPGRAGGGATGRSGRDLDGARWRRVCLCRQQRQGGGPPGRGGPGRWFPRVTAGLHRGGRAALRRNR